MRLILTAHGSADPRSAATTHAIAAEIRRQRPGLEVTAAFCEQNSPNLRDVLLESVDGVVMPLLLASAYHARVDIPAMIAGAKADVLRADTLGEDERLVRVLRERIVEAGVSRLDRSVGVVVTAVGSTRGDANARTSQVAGMLESGTNWTAALAFATGPRPAPTETAGRLRRCGATRLVVAPWFLAHGRITDRVAQWAHASAIPTAAPLGAHPLVAETVLDRFDRAVSARAAA